jgi:hypothetical protein
MIKTAANAKSVANERKEVLCIGCGQSFLFVSFKRLQIYKKEAQVIRDPGTEIISLV